MDAPAQPVKLAEQLFSPYSGNLLDSDNSTGDAYCALSGYRIPVHGEAVTAPVLRLTPPTELQKTVTVSRSNIKAFRLRYGVEPLVPDKDAIADQNTQRQRATIDESCPKYALLIVVSLRAR